MPTNYTMHGVTLDGTTLLQYFPDNAQFGYFLIRQELVPGTVNEYKAKIAAYKPDGTFLADLNLTNTSPVTISFTNWRNADVKIESALTLKKVATKKILGIPVGRFKLLNLVFAPEYYKDPTPGSNIEHTRYKVTITRQ